MSHRRLVGPSLHAALNQRQQLAAELEVGCCRLNDRDKDGDRCPLHWAAARGHTECVKLLLKAGADVHARDARGRTCEDLATQDALLTLKAWTLEESNHTHRPVQRLDMHI